MISTRDILNRLRQYWAIDTDDSLAARLGVPLNTLRGWLRRNSPDWNVLFEQAGDIDLNYLIRGSAIEQCKAAELDQLRAKVADYEALIIAAMKGNTAGFGSSTIFKRNEASLTDQ